MCAVSDGTTKNIVSSGVAADTNYHTFEIIFNDGVPNVVFKIDGAVVATLTANLPGNGNAVERVWNVADGAHAQAFREVAFYMTSVPTWP